MRTRMVDRLGIPSMRPRFNELPRDIYEVVDRVRSPVVLARPGVVVFAALLGLPRHRRAFRGCQRPIRDRPRGHEHRRRAGLRRALPLLPHR